MYYSVHWTGEYQLLRSELHKHTAYLETASSSRSTAGQFIQCKSMNGNRISCGKKITSSFRHPLGHFVKTLGASGDKETETEVLLLEHDVPYQEFSKRILDDLPSEGDQWVVTEKHLTQEKRRDLRHLNVCSIDPPGMYQD